MNQRLIVIFLWTYHHLAHLAVTNPRTSDMPMRELLVSWKAHFAVFAPEIFDNLIIAACASRPVLFRDESRR
jgi:hypothetical protein